MVMELIPIATGSIVKQHTMGVGRILMCVFCLPSKTMLK